MYWLYKWIDDNHIKRAIHMRQVLADSGIRRSLRNCAESAQLQPTAASDDLDGPLLAGEGLDPAGITSCYHPSCADASIRGIAMRVALYFDSIVLEDPFILPVIHDWESFMHRVEEGRFEAFIELLLHFREIGAEPFLSFSPKPHLGREQLQEIADKLGLASRWKGASTLLDQARQECEVKLTEDAERGCIRAEVSHPDIGAALVQHVRMDADESADAIRVAAIQNFLVSMLGHLFADVAASRSTGAALGMTSTVHQRLLSISPTQSPADIAFQLRLPVLDGVPTNELLAVRGEHEDEFRRFKTAIRRAMKEHLIAGAAGVNVAAEIQADVIDPEIQRISARLAAAESVLNKKTAVGVGVGAVTTTCGLLLGLGATAVAAGIASMLGVTGAAAVKHIEQTAEVAQSDVYYLWRLGQGH